MVTDAVFSDIDQDGDEDLLVVGEWMEITVLENTNGSFIKNSKGFGLSDTTRGFWWSITVSDIDNDGDDDYILGNLGKNNKFKATKEHPFKVYTNDFDGTVGSANKLRKERAEYIADMELEYKSIGGSKRAGGPKDAMAEAIDNASPGYTGDLSLIHI